LHPVAVIFAVLAGGQLFGFVGVLLALPVAAVTMVFIRYLHDQYKESEYYAPESESASMAELATPEIEGAEQLVTDSSQSKQSEE